MTFLNRDLAARGVSPKALEARALRRRLHVTQREFAAMVGVSVNVIWRYELGDKVRASSIAKIDAVLERWREVPPVPRRETRGRKARPANDNAPSLASEPTSAVG